MGIDLLGSSDACLARARRCFVQAQKVSREHRDVLVTLGYAFLDFALDLERQEQERAALAAGPRPIKAARRGETSARQPPA
jgi:hypothetical protein